MAIKSKKIQGVYAITDPRWQARDEQLYQSVQAAIDGGITLLQYRNKQADPSTCRRQAQMLARLCQQQGVIFIVNDSIELAAEVAADGVHLGKDDDDIYQARQRLGQRAIIGVSCYNSLSRALLAEQNGADYVAFGRFFASTTKPDAVLADQSILRQAKKELSVSVVAIGGIDCDNAASLIEAGADAIALIETIFSVTDPALVCSQLCALFRQ